jgi:hypothetical protein
VVAGAVEGLAVPLVDVFVEGVVGVVETEVLELPPKNRMATKPTTANKMTPITTNGKNFRGEPDIWAIMGFLSPEPAAEAPAT